jgi:hypothetical protein
MSRITGLLLVSALLAACASPVASPSGASLGASAGAGALPSGWITFTAPDGSFSVGLPSQPTASTQTVTTANGQLQLYSFQAGTADGQTVYGVSYADYPTAYVQAADHQAILDGAVNGFITTSKGTLVQSHAIDVGGVPGRDLTSTVQGGSMHGRIYLSGTRLYQMTTASSDPSMPNADAFLASFAILH